MGLIDDKGVVAFLEDKIQRGVGEDLPLPADPQDQLSLVEQRVCKLPVALTEEGGLNGDTLAVGAAFDA